MCALSYRSICCAVISTTWQSLLLASKAVRVPRSKQKKKNCKHTHIHPHREKLCQEESLKISKKAVMEKLPSLWWIIKEENVYHISANLVPTATQQQQWERPEGASFIFHCILYYLTLMTSYSWALLLEKQF